MRWSYDQNIDALYVYLHDGEIAAQVETASGYADVDVDRQILGVEVLSARQCFDAQALSNELLLGVEARGSLRFLEVELRRQLFAGSRQGLAGAEPSTSTDITASQHSGLLAHSVGIFIPAEVRRAPSTTRAQMSSMPFSSSEILWRFQISSYSSVSAQRYARSDAV